MLASDVLLLLKNSNGKFNMAMSQKRKNAKKTSLIKDYGACCWWCETYLPAKNLTLDHLKPSSKGGSNSLENLRLACFPCNNSRGNSLFAPRRVFAAKSNSTITGKTHA